MMAVCLCLVHNTPALIRSPHSHLLTLIHVVILPLVYTVASTLVCVLVFNVVCDILPLLVPMRNGRGGDEGRAWMRWQWWWSCVFAIARRERGLGAKSHETKCHG